MLSSRCIDEVRLLMHNLLARKRYYGENVADAEEASRFRAHRAEMRKVISVTSSGDFLPWLKSKRLEHRMIECQQNREDFFWKLIDQSRRRMMDQQDEERKKTMVEVLLSQQESEPECYTNDMIASLMLTFSLGLLSAGTETSINTMEWILSLLRNHPEVMHKARKEIETIVGLDRLIDELDVANLPYLRNIIGESMWMDPKVPLLVPHESTSECRASLSWRQLSVEDYWLTHGSLIQCFEWKRIGEEMVDMTEGTRFTMNKAPPLQAKCHPCAALVKLLNQI
ncbi:hypothetical protein SLEP1_g59027 [Rubroshorea leprosula]|uniref:Cytochrome P450 n=1 Tax=Rubroshorea leprosula TaxID=152421 RepID=A0AAV5MR89_9ROSI|nr:hypothetical protein SLEP1_g59027 [Rubroshorea leprosula]